MIFIPGILISIVTFPGVIVHELAHQLACYLVKVPVFQVKYFQFKRPNGYVIHEQTTNYKQTIAISMGPFLLNSIVGCFIFNVGIISSTTDLLNILLAWIGISIMMHAFPSSQDLKHVFAELKGKRMPFLKKMIVFPIAVIMQIGTWGSVVWLDLFYAIGLGFLVNTLIIG